MSFRLLASAITAGLLSGCTWTWLEKSEPEKPQARSIGIGWIGHDWRACEEGINCPKPTPKTIVMPAPRSAATTPLKQSEAPVESAPSPVLAHRVNFRFARAIPTKDGIDQLTNILRAIRETHVIHVTGHTDDIGGDRFNERLALRRAEFVAAWLKRRGIRNPMEVEARGKCCYLAPNETDDGRAINRRVEIILRERRSDPASSKTSTTKKEIVR